MSSIKPVVSGTQSEMRQCIALLDITDGAQGFDCVILLAGLFLVIASAMQCKRALKICRMQQYMLQDSKAHCVCCKEMMAFLALRQQMVLLAAGMTFS